MLKAGHLIDRFELVCPIGEGGMAHVWAAKERTSGAPGGGRLVALKIIHSRYVEDPSFRAMFKDEASVIMGVDHPNVAKVFDLVESPQHLYLVMEYVDGESLFELVSQYRTAPLPFALKVCADVCGALHAVHSLPRNVVHRDVSPQNILVSVTGDVKIIDFGIAHARDRHAETTALGMVKGKLRYMAPEQAKRAPLGPYTDVFGIGATLFRIVVGKPPYTSESDVATMQALLRSAPPTVPFPPELPPEVARVIAKAIAPEIAQRYASCAELQRDLLELLGRLGQSPNVAGFVQANMSEAAKKRRAELGAFLPSDLPQTANGTALMAPLPPTKPDGKRGPLPPPSDAERDPGFMDVHAIVRSANNPVPDLPHAPLARPVLPPKNESAPGPSRPQQEPAVELAFQPRSRVMQPQSNAQALRAAILVVGVVVVVFIALIAVPAIAKSRAIAMAREAGFDMRVEHTGVGIGTVAFKGVKLKALKVPGVTATIDDLHVDGWSVKGMRAVGVTVEIDGPPSDWDMGLALMLSENRVRFGGSGTASKHYSIQNGHLVWKGPAGAGLDAQDVGVEIDAHGLGFEDVHTTMGKVRYDTGKASIGPWQLSFESSASASRLRVVLDPAVPDGPSILVVSTPSAPAQITAKIARTPIANLGIQPAELGLPAAGSTEIETTLVGTVSPDGRLAIRGPISLWGLKIKDVPKPVDVRIDGGASGELGKPLDIDRTTSIAFGPFVAAVSGTITPAAGNLRVDALAKANPIPCATLARSEARTMGSFASMLAALGQSATSPVRLTGTVNASVAVKWDSGDPAATEIDWVARETCGLSIFGM